MNKFQTLTSKLSPGDSCTLLVKRAGQELELPLTVGSQPMRIEFVVSHDQIVNAWAAGHQIGVTSGLVRVIVKCCG